MDDVEELKTLLSQERARNADLMLDSLKDRSWLWYWRAKFESLDKDASAAIYGEQ